MANPVLNRDVALEIVAACFKLYQRRLVANHDGNVTYRLGDGFFAATPTAFSKGDLTVDDLLIVNESGQVVSGRHKVFSEISWHLAIYRARRDVSCVVHAHPVTASAYALAGRDLGTPALPEAIVSLGRHILSSAFFSPLDEASFAPGGAFEIAVQRLLSESDAFLTPGNGAWTTGQNILQTYYRMELVEHVAQQHHAAEQLGEIRRLPSELVTALMKKRPASGAVPAAAADSSRAVPLPSLKYKLPPASHEGAGLTRADLKDVVRAEIEKLLL